MNMLAPKRPGFHFVERGVTHAPMGRQKMECAILWTPLLTPLAQMNTFAPKGAGFYSMGRACKGTWYWIDGIFMYVWMWINLVIMTVWLVPHFGGKGAVWIGFVVMAMMMNMIIFGVLSRLTNWRNACLWNLVLHGFYVDSHDRDNDIGAKVVAWYGS
jgi:hypothetical protein